MRSAASAVVAFTVGLIAACAQAAAAHEVHTYAIVHPLYGEIGTYTQVIDQVAGTARIDTHLRVAVKLLGVVAYREEADGTEVLEGDRLVALESVTLQNGSQIEVRGEAQGDRFVVNSSFGTFVAPANVAPSDPWLLRQAGPRVMVSTKTGKVESALVFGGENTTISLGGAQVAARHFTIVSSNRQEVWLNPRNVPLKFRTVVNGTLIDFILVGSLSESTQEKRSDAAVLTTGQP